MTTRTGLGFAAVALALAGCNLASSSKSDRSSSANGSGSSTTDSGNASVAATLPAGFLTSPTQILPPANITPLVSADALTTLVGTGDFFDNNPVNATDCGSTAYDALPFQGTDAYLTIDTTIDLRTCYSSTNSSSNLTVTYTTASSHFFIVLGCSQGGLTKYIGQPFKTLESLPLQLICPGSVSEQFEAMTTTAATYQGTDSSGNPYGGTLSGTTVSYNGKQDLSPCTVTFSGTLSNLAPSCDNLTISTSTQATTGTGTTPVTTVGYTALINATLLAEQDDETTVWPTSGTYDVTFNNWAGTVVYSGPTTPPSYSLTSTSGALNGRFPAPAVAATPAVISPAAAPSSSLALAGARAGRTLKAASRALSPAHFAP